ncbi:5027_t:CDS:2, partial [Entrophospora sp. SA101]
TQNQNNNESNHSLSQLTDQNASFTAKLEDGSLIDATQNITQNQAIAAHNLLQNINLLLDKQENLKLMKKDDRINKQGENNDSIENINNITVLFKDCNYSLAINDDKIYCVKRSNEDRTEQ